MIGQKAKSKINIVDMLVIVIFLFMLISAIYFFSARSSFFLRNVFDAEYEIFVESIPDEFVNNISVGDIIYDTVNVVPLGTVTDARIEYKYDNEARLVIYIRTKAKSQNGVLSVNGIVVSEGEAVDFRTANLAYRGVFRNIFVTSDQGV